MTSLRRLHITARLGPDRDVQVQQEASFLQLLQLLVILFNIVMYCIVSTIVVAFKIYVCLSVCPSVHPSIDSRALR